MTVTLTDILADVDDRFEDWPQEGGATVECDGVANSFHLPDRFICDDASFEVYLETIATSNLTLLSEGIDYEMNYNTNWLGLLGNYFTDPPDDTYRLVINYRHKHWPTGLQTRLVNESLSYLFPAFYVIAHTDLVPDGTTKTFLVETIDHRPAEGIIDVDETDSGGTAIRYTPFRDYRVNRRDAYASYLNCFTAPSNGSTLTVYFACRPAPFVSLTDSLTDLGLPDRMRTSIVYYTCWKQHTQKVQPLLRRDLVDPYENEARTTFRDQTSAIQLYKALLDTETRTSRMRPWNSRGL